MTLPESVQKWIKALRSGEYKQGQIRLCRVVPNDDYAYCCLGVACELYMKEFPDKLQFVDKMEGIYTDGKDRWSISLPTVVKEWLGLKDEYGTYKRERDVSLGKYNDSGYTFDQIADIIERDYELMKQLGF